MGKQSGLMLSTCLLGLAAGWPGQAMAQVENVADSAGVAAAFGEIIVTARKRSEALQDIPISISAIGADAITRKGITSIGDVASQTPGLTFDVGLVPTDTRISIRGLQAVRGRPNVAILVDGIDSSSENFGLAGGGILANLRLVDVERIEVVKGPQNVLYGRAAFAGAVNYITKKPSKELTAEASLEAARFGTFETRAAISGPLGDSGFSARVNGVYYTTNGDYDADTTGGDLNKAEAYGGALALRYDDNGPLTADLRVQYGEEKFTERAAVLVRSVNPTTGAPNTANGGVLLPDLRPTAPFPILIYSVTGDLSQTDAVINQQLDISPDPNNGGAAYEGSEVKTFRASMNLDWETDFGTFTSLTGVVRNTSTFNEDFDHTDFALEANTPIPAYSAGGPFSTLAVFQGQFGWPLSFLPAYGLSGEFDSKVKIRQFSQELRWTKDFDRLRTVVDALYWRETADYRDRSLFWLREGGNQLLAAFVSFGQLPPPAGSGFHLLSPPATSPTPQNITRTTNSYSIAASAEYELTDTLTAIVEGRFIKDRIVYTGFDFDPFIVNTYGATPGGPTETDPPIKNSKLTPRASLAWKAMPDLLVYATYARGTKPGGVDTTDQNGNVNDGRFTPEQIDSFELGSKFVGLEGRLVANAALFYNIYKDQQIGIIESINGIPQSRTVNIGESKTKGVELDLQWSPVDQLFLRAAYTYTNAKFTDYVLPRCGPTDSAETGTPDCTFTGNKSPQTPANQLNLSARYEYPVSEELKLWAEVDGRYLSRRFLAASNLAWLPSYWQADARIGVTSDQWGVEAYVKNLFDDDTPRTGTSSVDYGYFDLNAFQLPRGYLVALAPRRTFGARVSYKF